MDCQGALRVLYHAAAVLQMIKILLDIGSPQRSYTIAG